MQIDLTSASARKQETAKRLNFYHGMQLERLEEQMVGLFSEPEKMVKTYLNITRKVVNNLAQIYRTPPVRTIEGTERDQGTFNELADTCALDVKMKQASRYCKLLKTILLRPVWRNNKIDLDILTGNILDVQTGDSPEMLEAVLVTDYGQSDKVEDVTYRLWTPETWQKLDYRGHVIKSDRNPYEIIPFLPVFDYPPVSSSFWLPGNDDLTALQEAINLKLTDLTYLISQQSFGVGFIKGSTGGSQLRVDPGCLVELPENGEIGFRSQEAKITEVLEAIQKLVTWTCVANGLSAAHMSTDPQIQSGVSKAWDSKELNEMRADDAALWRSYEKGLFNLMRLVWNVHNPAQKLSDAAFLKIDFADSEKQVLSVKDQAQADDLQMAQGVISPVDIALRDNPDFQGDREKALAHLLTIKQELNELND
jgi:hypothetical protein